MEYFILFITLSITVSCQECRPFGVRLNFGTFYSHHQQSSSQLLAIRFNTKLPCQKSYITIQKSSSSIRKIYCSNTKLQFSQYTTFIHKCSIQDIKQGQTIQYMAMGWSGNNSDPHIPYRNQLIVYYFPYVSQQWKMVSIADWSYLRQLRTKYKPLDDSFQYLLKNDKNIKALFINGDVAYDLQSNNGQNYQDFLKMLSQVSIQWAIIINPGNHQHRDNNSYILNATFQCYRMLQKRVATLIISKYFNLILFDPYQIMYNKQPQNKSYSQYKQKLDKSYKQNNLTILASHYPFRCNGIQKDCITKHQQISQFYSAMFQTNVPVYLGAHYHAYQRHYPFKYNNTYITKNGPYQWRYDMNMDQRYLISIVEGVAGPTIPIQQFTAGYKFNVTGYGIFKVGESVLSYQHYTSDDANKPIDSFVMNLKRLKLQLRTQ